MGEQTIVCRICPNPATTAPSALGSRVLHFKEAFKLIMNLQFHQVYRAKPQALQIILIAGLGLLSGCAKAPPQLDSSAGLRCVDDTPRCVKLRIATLNGFKADSERRWVARPAGPKAYATGVRMFAYRDAMKKLSCSELQHGRREAAGARSSLRSPGAGLSPAQISRALMLANDVGRDLKRESRRRCK